MTANTKASFFEPALIYGGIIGVILVIHSVIVSIAGANFSTYNQIASIVIPLAALVYCLRAYRIEYLSGFMTYGQSFIMGFVILIVSGLISVLYSYVYIEFINPDFFREAQIVMEEKLIKRGMDEGMIDTVIEQSARMRTVKWALIMGMLSSVFSGAIISLIVSAFMKKEPKEPFRDVV